MLVLAGDGGTYDIGLQCLSSAAERNENILYVCLDNEGYMNTGAQKSSSTPHYARTSSTPSGKPTRKKNLTAIMAAHGIPYAATASIGFLPDMLRKVEKAKAIRGFRILTLLVPCVDGWGLADDAGLRAARLAVECGAFPLYEVEDGNRYTINHTARTRPVSDYLALQKRYRSMGPGRHRGAAGGGGPGLELAAAPGAAGRGAAGAVTPPRASAGSLPGGCHSRAGGNPVRPLSRPA